VKKLLLILLCAPFTVKAQKSLKLWYQQPARLWTQALPVGNGRLAAMIFGKPSDELIQLNESTLWSGGPVSQSVNPDAVKYLPQVRKAIFDGDYQQAVVLSKKMQGSYSESYLPLADLSIKQDLGASEATAYYRDLDISRALSTTNFEAGGIRYKREIFASAPDQVIVVHLTGSKAHALNIRIGTTSQLRFQKFVTGDQALLLKGRAPAHVEPN